MKTDHLNLMQRMVFAASQYQDWDGNSAEYELAWAAFEVGDEIWAIWEEISSDWELIWPDKVGEPALFAIVTENRSGQVEVLTFKDQRAWRALVRHLQANYEAWLDAEEDEA